MGWQEIGVIIVGLSLIVNFLQYLQNRKLKGKINSGDFSDSEIKTEKAQTHMGKGNNYNVEGDADINH